MSKFRVDVLPQASRSRGLRPASAISAGRLADPDWDLEACLSSSCATDVSTRKRRGNESGSVSLHPNCQFGQRRFPSKTYLATVNSLDSRILADAKILSLEFVFTYLLFNVIQADVELLSLACGK